MKPILKLDDSDALGRSSLTLTVQFTDLYTAAWHEKNFCDDKLEDALNSHVDYVDDICLNHCCWVTVELSILADVIKCAELAVEQIRNAIAECTLSDADAFLAAVERNCEGFTVAVGCLGPQCEHAEHDSDPDNHQCEPSFSWTQCDSCGSSLGGDRHHATMIPLDYKAGEDTMIDVGVCTDCALFWANGDLPEVWE